MHFKEKQQRWFSNQTRPTFGSVSNKSFEQSLQSNRCMPSNQNNAFFPSSNLRTMTLRKHPERVTFETLIRFLTLENNDHNIHRLQHLEVDTIVAHLRKPRPKPVLQSIGLLWQQLHLLLSQGQEEIRERLPPKYRQLLLHLPRRVPPGNSSPS